MIEINVLACILQLAMNSIESIVGEDYNDQATSVVPENKTLGVNAVFDTRQSSA